MSHNNIFKFKNQIYCFALATFSAVGCTQVDLSNAVKHEKSGKLKKQPEKRPISVQQRFVDSLSSFSPPDVEKALNDGASVNEKFRRGNSALFITPLDWVLRTDHVGLMHLLLAHGATLPANIWKTNSASLYYSKEGFLFLLNNFRNRELTLIIQELANKIANPTWEEPASVLLGVPCTSEEVIRSVRAVCKEKEETYPEKLKFVIITHFHKRPSLQLPKRLPLAQQKIIEATLTEIKHEVFLSNKIRTIVEQMKRVAPIPNSHQQSTPFASIIEDYLLYDFYSLGITRYDLSSYFTQKTLFHITFIDTP